FGMTEDAEDAALVLEFVQHQAAFLANTRSMAVDQLRSASSTDTSIAAAPATAIRSRFPPVSPITRAATRAAAARCSTSATLSGVVDTTMREADSPNSA